MEQLKNFNLHNLFRQLQLSDEDFEEWLKTLKLLPRRKICECGQDMNFKWKKESKYPLWICYKKTNHDGKQPTKDGKQPKKNLEDMIFFTISGHKLHNYTHKLMIYTVILLWNRFIVISNE